MTQTLKQVTQEQAFAYAPEASEDQALVMAPDAYIGPAGRFVEALAPITEADRVALLGHYLAYFGSIIGRSAAILVEGHMHYCTLFVGLIGESAVGRKGTARRRTEQVFKEAFPDFISTNVVSGLHSGEGLIYRVRDGVHGADPDKKGADLGVTDKRLLVVEEEFSSPLRRMKLQGNTLSSTLRSAWDGDTLQTIVKNDPNIATGAHISVVGHGVRDEIVEELDQVAARNGLANRFLWLWSERARFLSRGGSEPANMSDLVADIQHAVSRAEVTYTSPIDFDDQALTLWNDVYVDLSTGRPGFIGRLTSRAEAITTRLALIYAALDNSLAIEERHLMAALAIWDYSLESVRKIFGDSTGNRFAEKIAIALNGNPEGLDLTAINRLFSGHAKPKELREAINDLVTAGRAEIITEQTEGPDRMVVRRVHAN